MGAKTTTKVQRKAKSVYNDTKPANLSDAQQYLTRAGYLTSTISPGVMDENTSQALKVFQKARGVRATGTLSDKTLEAMKSLSFIVGRYGDSGNQAGVVSELVAVRHRQHQIITAVRTEQGASSSSPGT